MSFNIKTRKFSKITFK